MLYLFSGADEDRFPDIFTQMYAQRFEIYVRRRKWPALQPIGGLEKDQYDIAQASYLLAVAGDGTVLAGLRLLPTTRSHLFVDLFPHLAGDGAVPVGDDILELTRFYVAPAAAARRSRRERLIGVISAGMFEFCLEKGIRQISSVVDTFLLPQMLDLGWTVRLLGPARRYGQGVAVGVLIDVSEEALRSTLRIKKITGPLLRPPAPAGPTVSPPAPWLVRHHHGTLGSLPNAFCFHPLSGLK